MAPLQPVSGEPGGEIREDPRPPKEAKQVPCNEPAVRPHPTFELGSVAGSAVLVVADSLHRPVRDLVRHLRMC